MFWKFDEIKIDKKEFQKSKQPIDLNLVDTNKIVISDKFERNDESFKYFIGYKDDNIIRLSCSYVLFYLRWVDTWNILKMEEKICFASLKMIVSWLNIIKFGTKLEKLNA